MVIIFVIKEENDGDLNKGFMLGMLRGWGSRYYTSLASNLEVLVMVGRCEKLAMDCKELLVF
jgi:hypothetical protein